MVLFIAPSLTVSNTLVYILLFMWTFSSAYSLKVINRHLLYNIKGVFFVIFLYRDALHFLISNLDGSLLLQSLLFRYLSIPFYYIYSLYY